MRQFSQYSLGAAKTNNSMNRVLRHTAKIGVILGWSVVPYKIT